VSKKKIFVAGHNGMAGSAICRLLKKKNNVRLIVRNKKQLNLLDQRKVYNFLKNNKPDSVIVAAGKVGGIYANSTQKYNFLYENLQIQNNIINGSFEVGIKNLLFLGSSCIYPAKSKQPIKEIYLLTGELEKTNDAYAIAKIAGLKLCQFLNEKYDLNYKTLMPNNLFGPGDNYNTKNSHFFPALIKKVVNSIRYKKKHVELWGSGKPLRELMYVDDLAHASVFFLNKKTNETIINIGSGIELSIENYLKKIINYFEVNLKIKYINKMPDGMFRKRLDLTIARKYGWKSNFDLDTGIDLAIKDYLKSNKITLKI
jgi:GDP-L-fucose synthase